MGFKTTHPRTGGLCLVFAGIALLGACSGRPSRTENASGDDLSHKTVRVVFELPGDDIGGQEPQRVLEAVREEVLRRRTAEVVSSGYGMGSMEIVLKYGDGGSLEELRKMIAAIYPRGRYRIESGGRMTGGAEAR